MTWIALTWLICLAPVTALLTPTIVFGAEASVSDPAAQQIQSFYATLVDCMKGGKSLGTEGRYKKLQPSVEATFDLSTMARLSVGPAWDMMSPAEREQVLAAFTRMTIANYAAN